MSKFYGNSEQAMWAWLAWEIKDLPMANTRELQILAAIGGAIDPDGVTPANETERNMLRFAKKLEDMRDELEFLRSR